LGFEVLDVGCGSNVSYEFRPHIKATILLDIEKPRTPVPNFVVGDVCHLPFRMESFDEVYCSHVLEHVEEPVKALKELIRVSRDMVTIKVPHRFSRNAKRDPSHINFFNVRWFKKALKHLHVDLYHIEVKHRGFPHPYVAVLNFPEEIIVRIRKGGRARRYTSESKV